LLKSAKKKLIVYNKIVAKVDRRFAQKLRDLSSRAEKRGKKIIAIEYRKIATKIATIARKHKRISKKYSKKICKKHSKKIVRKIRRKYITIVKRVKKLIIISKRYYRKHGKGYKRIAKRCAKKS